MPSRAMRSGRHAASIHKRPRSPLPRTAARSGARSPLLLKTTLQVSGTIRRGGCHRPRKIQPSPVGQE